MSSMAALPFATSPAEEVAPCCAEVAAKPVLKGSVPMNSCSFSPAVVQHSSEKSSVEFAACITSVGQLCRAKLYHQ